VAAGVWDGTLAVGPNNFRLKVQIPKTAAGAATGTIESVDQGAKDIPLSAITCKEGAVHFEARGIGAFYDGTLSPAGVILTGQWHQSGQALPLEFKKVLRSSLNRGTEDLTSPAYSVDLARGSPPHRDNLWSAHTPTHLICQIH
jgi:hypothetical protein